MTRARFAPHFGVLVALAATGCVEGALSAGSNDSDTVPAPLPTTRATVGAMIDTFAMDADNLYFTEENGSLYRLAKAGTSAPVLVAAAATPGSVYTEGLAMDDATLYWTALGDGISTGNVLSVAKSGGSAAVIASGQARPTGIAVDGTNVYWTNQGPPGPAPNNNLMSGVPSVMRAPKAGGAGGATTLVETPLVPDAITLDATSVIWHEQQAIRRVPKTGGSPMTLTDAAIPFTTSNLVVSGGTLVWAADQGVWSLQSVALQGGTVTTLASPIDAPGAILVDGTSIFWNASNGSSVGAIIHEPQSGGSPPTTYASADVPGPVMSEGAKLLLADAHAFYWVEYWESPALTVAVRVLTR
jgi:hypothetical protein